MIETVATGCMIALALSMLPALYRILVGPSIADRVVGADNLVTIVTAIVIVTGFVQGTREYMDAVMAMAIRGFFGTVAVAKYLIQGKAID